MDSTFYDVKTRAKVKTAVVEKVEYGTEGRKRYAVRGKTSDGRNLTKFVSKEAWDKADVPKGKPAAKKAAPKKKK